MKAKKTGISKYLDNGNDDDSDDESFEDQKDDDIFDGEGDKSMMAEKDPSKLIDLELVNLLRFCNDLKKKHKETEDY
jgi:Dullard-like phosphatase family protein